MKPLMDHEEGRWAMDRQWQKKLGIESWGIESSRIKNMTWVKRWLWVVWKKKQLHFIISSTGWSSLSPWNIAGFEAPTGDSEVSSCFFNYLKVLKCKSCPWVFHLILTEKCRRCFFINIAVYCSIHCSCHGISWKFQAAPKKRSFTGAPRTKSGSAEGDLWCLWARWSLLGGRRGRSPVYLS